MESLAGSYVPAENVGTSAADSSPDAASRSWVSGAWASALPAGLKDERPDRVAARVDRLEEDMRVILDEAAAAGATPLAAAHERARRRLTVVP